MADLEYYRILKSKQRAVWGEITVKGVTFAAVENRTKKYDSLPAGVYRVQMDLKEKSDSDGKEVNCLRFIQVRGRDGKNNPFLIHRAWHNDWTTLKGCIAPGNCLAPTTKDL